MYIGAFDIGGTKTIVALADETGKIYEKQQYPTDTADCLRHLDSCCEIFLQFMHKHQLQPNQILGIGVNLPGIVDRKQGILLRAVYAGWHDVPVKNYLIKKIHVLNIVCENDVNSCAVGELRFGLGQKYKDFGCQSRKIPPAPTNLKSSGYWGKISRPWFSLPALSLRLGHPRILNESDQLARQHHR